jgi:hypothetical protein
LLARLVCLWVSHLGEAGRRLLAEAGAGYEPHVEPTETFGHDLPQVRDLTPARCRYRARTLHSRTT